VASLAWYYADMNDNQACDTEKKKPKQTPRGLMIPRCCLPEIKFLFLLSSWPHRKHDAQRLSTVCTLTLVALPASGFFGGFHHFTFRGEESPKTVVFLFPFYMLTLWPCPVIGAGCGAGRQGSDRGGCQCGRGGGEQ
jgi:hypothetical protein